MFNLFQVQTQKPFRVRTVFENVNCRFWFFLYFTKVTVQFNIICIALSSFDFDGCIKYQYKLQL